MMNSCVSSSYVLCSPSFQVYVVNVLKALTEKVIGVAGEQRRTAVMFFRDKIYEVAPSCFFWLFIDTSRSLFFLKLSLSLKHKHRPCNLSLHYFTSSPKLSHLSDFHSFSLDCARCRCCAKS